MMGYPPTPLNEGSGIIPVACSKIFEKINGRMPSQLVLEMERDENSRLVCLLSYKRQWLLFNFSF